MRRGARERFAVVLGLVVLMGSIVVGIGMWVWLVSGAIDDTIELVTSPE